MERESRLQLPEWIGPVGMSSGIASRAFERMRGESALQFEPEVIATWRDNLKSGSSGGDRCTLRYWPTLLERRPDLVEVEE